MWVEWLDGTFDDRAFRSASEAADHARGEAPTSDSDGLVARAWLAESNREQPPGWELVVSTRGQYSWRAFDDRAER